MNRVKSTIPYYVYYLQFLQQSVSTTALTVMMETTNPATRVMDMFHAAVVLLTTCRAHLITKTNLLFCGTTLNEHARKHPLPVIQLIYHIKEYFCPLFLKRLLLLSSTKSLFSQECKLLTIVATAFKTVDGVYLHCK